MDSCLEGHFRGQFQGQLKKLFDFHGNFTQNLERDQREKEKHSSFKRQASVNILEGQFLGQFLGQFPAQFCGQDQLEKVKQSSLNTRDPVSVGTVNSLENVKGFDFLVSKIN